MSSSLSSHSAPFASGTALVLDCLKAFLPPEPTDVAEFTAKYRWVSNEGGGYVGRWNHDEAPYLEEPMQVLSDDQFRKVPVVGPGQCGKTEIARNWLHCTALTDPAPMLWYSSSEPLVTSEVKTHITRLIADHPRLRELLTDSSLAFKRFGRMPVEFLPGIISYFTSKSAPRLVMDEFDAIAKALPNVMALADVRAQTFGSRSKILAMCHPDLAKSIDPKDWTAGIMELYAQSDRRVWYWQCPECGCVSSPNPTGARVMTIHYDEAAPEDEIRDMARLLCPVNGCLVEDGQRRAMNLTGRWIGMGQQIDQDGLVTGERVKRTSAGFWIVGAMSPFASGGIGGLAVARVRAERKFARNNDRKALGEVMSKQWGLPLGVVNDVGALDPGVVADRASGDLKLGVVANGVRFLTAFADVQGGRFELLVRGWGVNGESWVVDYRVIAAHPSTSAQDWDDLIALMTETAWPLADGSGRGMKARICGFDSGGKAGVTLQANDAWRRAKTAGKAKLLGRIDGRAAYTTILTKGASGLNAPKLQVVFPDTQRKDRFSGARGDVPVALFNPNSFKDDLMVQLAKADAGPWAVHFPRALRAAEPPHPFFEGMIAAEVRNEQQRWVPAKPKIPNEPMDLMVGTHLLAHLSGLARLRWNAPPVWAKDWDENANVIRLAPAERQAEVPPALPPAHVVAAVKIDRPASRFVTSIPVRR
jgi:phage terminase large subunit GpA-like protein